MNNDLLEAIDGAMQHASQAWAKLVYAPADRTAAENEAVAAAIGALCEVMDGLRPIRSQLQREAIAKAQTQAPALRVVRPDGA